MRSRFASNLILLLAGVVLCPARFIFTPRTVQWMYLGAGVLALLITAAAFLVRGRGGVQRGFDLCVVLLAAWAAVSAVAFDLHTAGWLAFASGGGLLSFGLIGLLAHEARMFRAVGEAALPGVDGTDSQITMDIPDTAGDFAEWSRR